MRLPLLRLLRTKSVFFYDSFYKWQPHDARASRFHPCPAPPRRPPRRRWDRRPASARRRGRRRGVRGPCSSTISPGAGSCKPSTPARHPRISCVSSPAPTNRSLSIGSGSIPATSTSNHPFTGQANRSRSRLPSAKTDSATRSIFRAGYSQGIFLDQRGNRLALRQEMRPGMALLNCFAYTCAFSVAAAASGARTTSVDLSRRALDWGQANFRLNALDPAAGHEFFAGDVFDHLRRFGRQGPPLRRCGARPADLLA